MPDSSSSISSRNKLQREQDREEAMRLLLKGWSFKQIAAYQERSTAIIGADIRIIEKRWRESAVLNLNEARQREIARIDLLEREAWTAWESSKSPRKASRTRRRQLPTLDVRSIGLMDEPSEPEPESRTNGHANGLANGLANGQVSGKVSPSDDLEDTDQRIEREFWERTDQRDGDPRFLERVAWCIQERSKLMGLYPDKTAGQAAEQEVVRRVVVYLPSELGPDAPAQAISLPAPHDVPTPQPNGVATTDLASLTDLAGDYADEDAS